jgi:predicted dehydrogenase
MSESLGVVIAGCGNIAGRYAADIARQTHVRLVGVTDLDAARATAFAAEHGTRAYRALEDALADSDVAIVANLTSHRAHVPVSTAAIKAGRHVFSEKPMAMTAEQAQALLRLADEYGVHVAAAPIVVEGELVQTARRWVDEGRLGVVRLAWADVNWGRIEAWHPDPVGFYGVGPLFDVGVYPVTLLTGLFGPVARVTADAHHLLPRRRTVAGEPFTIGAPDYVVASLEIEHGPVVRLTANFYVADPARQRGIELHGDAGSLWLSNWSQFDGSLEHAPWGEPFRPVPLLRVPDVPMPWAAGLDELASAMQEGREARISGRHAAHVVDVLETIRRAADQGRGLEVTSRFVRPPTPPWADDLPLV